METVGINLALQGGGAHGAFTWGALDRLLAENWIEIEGISGASAGALNGAALKSGWVAGGRDGAREALAGLWGQISGLGDLRIPAWMQGVVPEPYFTARALEFSPAFFAADAMSRIISPYAYGPFYQNPLERIVQTFDFGRVCDADHGPALACLCDPRARRKSPDFFSG